MRRTAFSRRLEREFVLSPGSCGPRRPSQVAHVYTDLGAREPSDAGPSVCSALRHQDACLPRMCRRPRMRMRRSHDGHLRIGPGLRTNRGAARASATEAGSDSLRTTTAVTARRSPAPLRLQLSGVRAPFRAPRAACGRDVPRIARCVRRRLSTTRTSAPPQWNRSGSDNAFHVKQPETALSRAHRGAAWQCWQNPRFRYVQRRLHNGATASVRKLTVRTRG